MGVFEIVSLAVVHTAAHLNLHAAPVVCDRLHLLVRAIILQYLQFTYTYIGIIYKSL